MRWPHADLEEKREPRAASSVRAQQGDSIEVIDWNLTSAALEKPTSVGASGNVKDAPIADYPAFTRDGEVR